MSAGTVKQYAKLKEKQDKVERPSHFFGIHCKFCGLTWIVCEMPQPMKILLERMSKHQYCPSCRSGGDELRPAAFSEIRPLLK